MTRPLVLPPIRCSQDEQERWRRAAELEGLSFSEWVRQELTLAAGFRLRESQDGAGVPRAPCAASRASRSP